jgi:HPt (histidine-containing phosphotransfer) domain-containing protein
MNLKECYEAFGGDYEGVMDRLASEEQIARYLRMFTDDDEIVRLKDAFIQHDDEHAFLAAHSIKGMALNLGLGRLTAQSDRLTEALRHGRTPDAEDAYCKTLEAYEVTASAIRELEQS